MSVVLIASLSIAQNLDTLKSTKKYYYENESDIEIDSMHTNKSIYDCLESHLKKQDIDKYILLCTTAAENWRKDRIDNKEEEKLNEAFICWLEEQCKDENRIQLDETNPISSYASVLNIIEPDDEVYIDMMGGSRDGASILQNLAKVLKGQGVTVKALKNDFKPNTNEPTKIYEMDIATPSDDFVEAVNLFQLKGDASLLLEWFENNRELKSDSEAEKIIGNLKALHNSLSMGCVSLANDNWNALYNALYDLNEDKIEDECFKLLIKIFKESIDGLTTKYLKDEKHDSDFYKESPYIFKLILWCIDNDLYQQALTLCDEYIPEFFKYNKKDFVLDFAIDTVEDRNDKVRKFEDHLADLKKVEGWESDNKCRIKFLYLCVDAFRDISNHASEKDKNKAWTLFEEIKNEKINVEYKIIDTDPFSLILEHDFLDKIIIQLIKSVIEEVQKREVR